MTPGEVSERAIALSLRVMRMADALPRSSAGRNIAGQLVRSACPAAANYRAAQRAKSHADFANKIAIVLEEADETAFWIDLATRAELIPRARLTELQKEADELVRIFATMRRTVRARG